jgi:hypothetical protein
MPTRCLQRAKDYSERFSLIDSGTFDFKAKDDARKQPPAELLVSSDAEMNVELRGDLEKVAHDRGWPMVRYKSRYSGGFDKETPSLLMIRVPGEKMNPPVGFDRYLNFALPADTGADEMNPIPQAAVVTPEEYRTEVSTGKVLPRTFTIVTLQKKTDSSPAKVFFERYVRQSNGSAVYSPLPPPRLAIDCYTCHVSGMREISPLGYHVREGERQMPRDAWLATKEMNDSMEKGMGYAAMDWGSAVDSTTGKPGKFLVPASYGPVYGPVSPLTREEKTTDDGDKVITFPTRTKDFILGKNGQPGCAQLRTTVSVADIFLRAPGRGNIYTLTQDPPIRWEKVRDAMKCASCHNNKQRGAMNAGTDPGEIDFKVLVDQSMPYGWHRNPMDRGDPSKPVLDLLNLNERIALVNCLRAEWDQEKDKTEAWLKESSCADAQ